MVLINGLFVAAEFSLVKIRDTQITLLRTKFGFRAKLISTIHHSLDAYLSACQLGITLSSLGLGWVGEPAFMHIIQPLVQAIGIKSTALMSAISISAGFATISFLHIVIGELAPKSMALRSTEKIALWTAIPIYYFYWIMYPLIYLLNNSALLFLWIIGNKTSLNPKETYTKDEIKLIISSNIVPGHEDDLEMLGNTLEFSDLSVADLMHSEDEMISINFTLPAHESIKIMMDNKYSRYPIYHKSKNNIIGIVHVKDIFSSLSKYKTPEQVELAEYMKPILSVPHDLPVKSMFEKFNLGYSHFAVVKNAINEIIGFVTLDNVISSLLGNINDEFNQVRSNWITLKNGAFLMKGSTPIYALEKALDITLPNLKVKTVSGLITNKTARIPKVKEHIYFDQFSIIVRKMRGPHILLVKVIPN